MREYTFDSSATVQTQLSPEALATAYRTQLEQAGWTRTTRQGEGLTYLSLWKHSDPQGQIWHTLLSLTEKKHLPISISHT